MSMNAIDSKLEENLLDDSSTEDHISTDLGDRMKLSPVRASEMEKST